MEKRSSRHETAQAQRVGARPDTPTLPCHGGGYLNTYRFCEFEKAVSHKKRTDPRLQTLRAIGLNKTLLEIADAIGVDNFLTMWEMLDSENQLRTDSGGLAIKIRSFRSYKRYLRNRHLFLMHQNCQASGMKKLSARARESLGESIDPSHIYRILMRTKI